MPRSDRAGALRFGGGYPDGGKLGLTASGPHAAATRLGAAEGFGAAQPMSSRAAAMATWRKVITESLAARATGRVVSAESSPRRRRLSGMRHALSLLLLVVFLAGATAPEPAPASCPGNGALIARFQAFDRAALVRHIPALANAPEVAIDADPIRVNGEPAGLSRGPLQVSVFGCFRYDEIPTIGPLLSDAAAANPPPSVLRNVVVIITATGEASWYTDVNLDGFRP